MTRELILHIGLHKTGSTSLQAFLAQNRERLLPHSIDYLPIGSFNEGARNQIGSGNGAYLARTMLKEDDLAYLPWTHPLGFASLSKALAQSACERVFVSSELFADAADAGWDKLIGDCSELGLNLRIVAAVRNHCDFLSSLYLQGIKRHHVTAAPGDWIRERYPFLATVRYHRFFCNLAARCDRRLMLLSYDKYAASGTLHKGLLSLLGVEDCHDWVLPPALNTTPSPEEIVFLRLCNEFSPLMSFSDLLSAASAQPERWSVVDAALQAEILQYFAEDTQNFLRDFGLSEDFFAPPCANVIDLDRLAVSQEQMRRLIARYFVHFDKRIQHTINRLAALEVRVSTGHIEMKRG